MRALWFSSGFATFFLVTSVVRAQTGCALEHKDSGAFICYPNPAVHAADANVGQVFHLSAQGNAPAGHKIRRYVVLIDGSRLSETRLVVPLHQISIETNLKAPYPSGRHTIGLFIDGAGTAKVSEISFHAVPEVGFCDLFSRVDRRNCVLTSLRGPLEWSFAWTSDQTPAAGQPDQSWRPFAGFIDCLTLYSRNLRSLEADVADATAVDAEGNLFIASHSFADIDIRKYGRNGSLLADTVVRSREPGFLSITALAVDDAGHAWIAGNTTALFPTTPGALATQAAKPMQLSGFVMRIDASKSGAAPVYFTYLSNLESRIQGVRVDGEGNAYLAGTTASMGFPHQASFRVSSSENSDEKKVGFIAALNATGTTLLWSTLLPGADLNALSRDHRGTLYLTGHSEWRPHRAGSKDILVTAVSDNGQRLRYTAHLTGSGSGRAIAVSPAPRGDWVFVTGSSDPVPPPATSHKHVRNMESFAIALQPCRTGPVYSAVFPRLVVADSPEIAIHAALDAFASTLPSPATATIPVDVRSRTVDIQAAPACSSSGP